MGELIREGRKQEHRTADKRKEQEQEEKKGK